MLVRDIMSGDIVSVTSEDTIEKTARLMKEHNIGSLPVCNDKTVIGIITDRDITLRGVASGMDISQKKVGDLMTTPPTVGTPEMNVHEAAKIMSEKQIRRLPVVDHNNLVGMVALGDISLQPTLSDNAEEALKNISKCNPTKTF